MSPRKPPRRRTCNRQRPPTTTPAVNEIIDAVKFQFSGEAPMQGAGALTFGKVEKVSNIICQYVFELKVDSSSYLFQTKRFDSICHENILT